MAAATLWACLLHEGGHLAAAALLGIPVQGLRLTGMGARMTLVRRCPLWQELILLLSGPVANLTAGLLLCRCQGLYTAGAVQVLLGCFNLLPVPPLDGGQAAQLLLETLLPGWTGWATGRGLAFGCCVLLLGLGLLPALKGNPALLLLAIWLTTACDFGRDVVS